MAKIKEVVFPFYEYLKIFYQQNKGVVKNNYKLLSKKFLDYNNPDNSSSFLRKPQYEALEIYIFLKEYLDNQRLVDIFQKWQAKTGEFKNRSDIKLFEELDEKAFSSTQKKLEEMQQDYPNYIFALTMGLGKTLLMATCIFYEFLLANKFPKDKRFCHNAFIIAPDKTVLQSLREIETFDKTKVVPMEYADWLEANLKFHYLDESGITLNTIDGDSFNLIISNSQKVILKKQHKNKPSSQMFFQSGLESALEKDHTLAELYELADLDDDISLTTNQRYKKLSRLPQLGIFVDEAHHLFGTKLSKDMTDRKSNNSLRVTIDSLAKELDKQGTHVVACYNYTGTPYAGKIVLPEVVYSYTLKPAIEANYLKKVRVSSVKNAKSQEAIKLAIYEFWDKHGENRYESMLPKIAIFASTVDELMQELRPAVEKVLGELGISSNKILINVGDDSITKNEDIREFNLLDTPASEKQFILLVNKGKEGWNCRSLFAVCLFRKPKSTVFVLQATMRCLRKITSIQQEALVFLSEDNTTILNNELEDNFLMSLDDLNSAGDSKKIPVEVHPNYPPPTITMKYTRKMYQLKEKNPSRIELAIHNIDVSKYQITRTDKDLLKLKENQAIVTDISHLREQRKFSKITLIAEIAQYLQLPCLRIQQILDILDISLDELLQKVNHHNELLHDHIIPTIFQALYDIEEFTKIEEEEVCLAKPPKEGSGYLFKVLPELLAKENSPEYSIFKDKTFHLDHYCFDSKPEFEYFISALNHKEVKKVWFTGMLTHGQSDFMVSYIDPESHTLRNYFPDFLIEKNDGSYIIIEVKGDNMLLDSVVLAKRQYAESAAKLNNMRYEMIAGSEALRGITRI